MPEPWTEAASLSPSNNNDALTPTSNVLPEYSTVVAFHTHSQHLQGDDHIGSATTGPHTQYATFLLSSRVVSNESSSPGRDPIIRPPAYNGDAVAAEVFKDSYFYYASSEEEERANSTEDCRKTTLLSGKTITSLLPTIIAEPGGFVSIAQQMDVNPDRLRAYFASAYIQAKQPIAEESLSNAYSCVFQATTIHVNDSLRPLGSLPPPSCPLDDNKRRINLDFLDPLRVFNDMPTNFFIPKSIYVRDCMRTIFGLFQEDVHRNKSPDTEATTLIGSPGVGSSVLLFLAALHCAQSKPVVYFRVTKDSREMPNLYMLTPDSRSGSVHVWFTLNIDSRVLKGNLSDLSVHLERMLGIRRQDYYAFVDGPRKAGKWYSSELLEGRYDYNCTSRGFSGFTDEEVDKRLWILDGWTKQETIDAFAPGPTLSDNNTEKAIQVYTLCGGKIRDMIEAWDDETIVKDRLDKLVEALDPRIVYLATVSTDMANTERNSDRLRTMFSMKPDPERGDSWKHEMHAYQVVDSYYILKKLHDILDISAFFKAYRFSQSSDLGSSRGTFFQHMIHQCVIIISAKSTHSAAKKGTKTLTHVLDVCRSTGIGQEGVHQFVRPNVYWIPSAANFANIDAAIVVNKTLYAFQMTTIQNQPTFNVDTFQTDFLDIIMTKRAFRRLKQPFYVYFVVPAGIPFKAPETEVDNVKYLTHLVCTTSVYGVKQSVHLLFDQLGHHPAAIPKPVHQEAHPKRKRGT